jgi:hypothetical protein
LDRPRLDTFTVRHASAATLGTIAPLLTQIRRLPGLKEPRPGVFYRQSRAFLHFHEHGDDVYADVRLSGPEFDRLAINTAAERQILVAQIQRALIGVAGRAPG